MPSLRTWDGRSLWYEIHGEGEPVVCHPGGPGFSGAYLGDLAGIGSGRCVVALDPRGTGRSDPPVSCDAYRLDDYVADLEAVREHLRLGQMDLLGHSHGALVALNLLETRTQRLHPIDEMRQRLLGGFRLRSCRGEHDEQSQPVFHRGFTRYSRIFAL